MLSASIACSSVSLRLAITFLIEVLSWNQLDDGRLIVVVYSPNKHALKGTDGPLLEVQTQLDVTTPVMVRDIVFITQQGMVHRFSPFQLGDQDDNTTDINHFGTPVSTQWQEGQTYYDLTGRKVGNAELHRSKGLKKGIYIINNMKVAIQ